MTTETSNTPPALTPSTKRRRFKPWSERLAAAEKRGKFTEREIGWSKDWTRCAIGEKHNWPIDGWFHPVDKEEDRLGMEFMWAVQSNDIPEAKRIYKEIQKL